MVICSHVPILFILFIYFFLICLLKILLKERMSFFKCVWFKLLDFSLSFLLLFSLDIETKQTYRFYYVLKLSMYMLQMEMVSHLKIIKYVAWGGSRENAEVMNIATQSGHGGRYRELSNVRICSGKCFQIEGFILLSVSNPMFVFLHYEYH